MSKPDREAEVTAHIPLSMSEPGPDVSAEPGSPTALAEEAERNFWQWCEVDHARKVAAIVTGYHQRFVPALAMGLAAARNLEIPPQQIAEQVGKVFGYILAALAGGTDPAALGIERSDETINQVRAVASTPPGGLRR
jgi:hypothetical protein